jgi:hypothetical protein
MKSKAQMTKENEKEWLQYSYPRINLLNFDHLDIHLSFEI